MNEWGREYREFTEYEIRAYKLWFEFLKLSDQQTWSEDVAEDFSDLSGSFEAWWPEHKYLFEKPTQPKIDEVLTEEQFQSYSDSRPSEGDPGILVLAVWMYQTKKDLRAAFEEILEKYHQGDAGRPEFDMFGEYYSLASRPDVQMMEKILAVYHVYLEDQKKPEKDRMPLWQIEEEASKTKQLIDKTSDAAEYHWKTKEVDASILESRRRSQHTTVRKYINYAEDILKNVVIGKFPVYNVSKSKKS